MTTQQFRIPRDGEPDIKFSGELIVGVSTSPDTARSDYSGSTGRWTELNLYKTRGGKWICARIEHTQWQGERDSHEAAVCSTEKEVAEWFGNDRLSKELLDGVIDSAEEVE